MHLQMEKGSWEAVSARAGGLWSHTLSTPRRVALSFTRFAETRGRAGASDDGARARKRCRMRTEGSGRSGASSGRAAIRMTRPCAGEQHACQVVRGLRA